MVSRLDGGGWWSGVFDEPLRLTQKGETIAHVFHTFYEKPFVVFDPSPTRCPSSFEYVNSRPVLLCHSVEEYEEEKVEPNDMTES